MEDVIVEFSHKEFKEELDWGVGTRIGKFLVSMYMTQVSGTMELT